MPDPIAKTLVSPEEHRMEKELRVCDPERTDRTQDMESWRILRIMAELVEGFDLLRQYRLAATFFGSSRATPEHASYKAAVALAGKLAQSGFAVVTGGAGGIMEAANKGAFEAKGQSVGLNILLPSKQHSNQYLTDSKMFHYFFTRKVMLSFAAEVYIYFPGGFGTLNEFFEIVTLIQTNKIKPVPVVLYGKEYWTPILALIKEHLYEKYKEIDMGDMNIYHIADTVDEAYDVILKVVNC